MKNREKWLSFILTHYFNILVQISTKSIFVEHICYLFFFSFRTMSMVMNIATGKEERIIVTNFKNSDPKVYQYERSCKYFNMLFEYVMATQGTFDGLILVMNSKDLNWRHIYKTPVNKMKKMLALVQVSCIINFMTILNK